MNVMSETETLKVQLLALRTQHRDLDVRIAEMQDDPNADQLTMRRLKKQKLHLKDQIARIEDVLYPDIIA